MNGWIVILVAVLLVFGSLFLLVGSIGLARLSDSFMRLHAPTKASTLGIGCVLVASSLYFSIELSRFSMSELVITLLLFITAPISAHMLAKTAMHLQNKPLERTKNQVLMNQAKERRPADELA